MDESSIFLAATQIDDPQLREHFLQTVCGHDPSLRTKIEQLLKQYGTWSEKLDRFTAEIPDRLDKIRREESAGYEPVDLTKSQPSFESGHTFRHYRVDRCLGVGGMGEVYLATDERLQRKVALKVLPKERMGDPTWMERFETEARAISALNHPNVLTIYEIGNDADFCFMVTEFIEGKTLRQIQSSGRCSLETSLHYAHGISLGLAAAHEAGLVHRDLKPENIMVRSDGLVKVLDFGLAKRSEEPHSNQTDPTSKLTAQGFLLGTVRYMSPEQVRRQTLDQRSDIFSFGVLLYELLVGQLPFTGTNDADVVAAILCKEPELLAQIVPFELRRLVEIMIRKDRDQRLVTAKEVSIELGLMLDSIRSPRTSQPRTPPTEVDTEWEVPEVFYARSGDVNIAYQVLGQGDFDIVFVMGWVSHLEWFWKEPSFAKFLRRLASFSRLILFDKRGTGLSDKVPTDQLPTLEQRMDDVRAVMQAVGSERAVLCGVSEGGPMCSLFAATYPQKTTALIMIGSYARRLQTHDYPWGPTEQDHSKFLNTIRDQWGGPVGIEARAPSKANDTEFRKWWSSYLRMGASPGAALALTRMNAQVDIRPILRSIQVPTMVLHRSGDQCLLVDEGRYLADNIPGALFVPLPGNDHLPFVGNQDEITSAIEEFLTGVKHDSHIKRILATVLVAEFVSSSESASSSNVATARSHAEREIALFRGKAFPSDRNQIWGTFDGPARAIRAALTIRASAQRLGVAIRIGLHTGECDEMDKTLSGPALQTANWVRDQATSGEIIVSSTIKDLVPGADFKFAKVDLEPAFQHQHVQLLRVEG